MIAKAAETFQFDTIDDVVSDIAKGRMVIVTDDADRENEGDLVMAAEKATPDAVNFMATHGRGLICVPISNERAEQLGLQRMVARNREMYRTDFTVSVDAARGVTTGISTFDRATTDMFFRCVRRMAAYYDGPDIPKRRSILRVWLAFNRQACFARFCTTMARWPAWRS